MSKVSGESRSLSVFHPSQDGSPTIAPAENAKKGPNNPQDAKAVALAQELAAAVAKPKAGTSNHDIDLSLSRIIKAVDFKSTTERGKGGTVRNVLSFVQGSEVGMIKGGGQGIITGPEIMELIRGRDYLSIITGEGDEAKTVVIMNDAVDKNKPGALKISVGGGEFEVWVDHTFDPRDSPSKDAVLKGGGLGPNSRIVLHPQTHIETLVKAPDDPARALEPPFFHQLQNDPNNPNRRANTCGLHAVNHAFGSAVFSHQAWDDAIIALRLQEMKNQGSEVDPDQFRLNSPSEEFFDLHTGVSAPEISMLLKDTIANGNKMFGKLVGYGFLLDRAGTVTPAVAKGVQDDRDVGSIIVHTGDHFVTFRRSETTQQWHLIDSMHPQTGQPISPDEYITNKLADKTRPELVSLLALYPSSPELSHAAANRHPQEPIRSQIDLLPASNIANPSSPQQVTPLSFAEPHPGLPKHEEPVQPPLTLPSAQRANGSTLVPTAAPPEGSQAAKQQQPAQRQPPSSNVKPAPPLTQAERGLRVFDFHNVQPKKDDISNNSRYGVNNAAGETLFTFKKWNEKIWEIRGKRNRSDPPRDVNVQEVVKALRSKFFDKDILANGAGFPKAEGDVLAVAKKHEASNDIFRVIVSTGTDFVAFRRDPETNHWYLLGSDINTTSQIRKTPSKYLEENGNKELSLIAFVSPRPESNR